MGQAARPPAPPAGLSWPARLRVGGPGSAPPRPVAGRAESITSPPRTPPLHAMPRRSGPACGPGVSGAAAPGRASRARWVVGRLCAGRKSERESSRVPAGSGRIYCSSCQSLPNLTRVEWMARRRRRAGAEPSPRQISSLAHHEVVQSLASLSVESWVIETK